MSDKFWTSDLETRYRYVCNGMTASELDEVMRSYYRYRGWHLPAFIARLLAAIVWGIMSGADEPNSNQARE